MSNTAELCARLLEHAAIHDRETSPYSPEQAAWAADLRDAAALIQAAPVVERADSATPVVERGAGNMSDNAALAAPAVPVAWHCPNDPDSATAFYWRRPNNGACPNCGRKLLPVVLAAAPTAELIPGTQEVRHVVEHGHACIAPRRVESPQAGAVAAHQARAGCERDDRA